MRKWLKLFVIVWVCFFMPSIARAEAYPMEKNFTELFNQHGAVMLLIEPQSGQIIYANNAASSFYGYSKAELEAMNIMQINSLEAHEVRGEMNLAALEQRNYFEFVHKLANGETRNVEVFSYPVKQGDKALLFSIVHDATIKAQLEERDARRAGIISFITAILVVFLVMLANNYKRLKSAKKELENSYTLRKTFIDADHAITYLKNENLKYVFVNKAFEDFFNKPAEDIVGMGDDDLANKEFLAICSEKDFNALKKQGPIEDEIEWGSQVYKTTNFPVKMLNGKNGVGAYIEDITEEKKHEKKLEQAIYRNKILLDMFNRSFTSRQEQLDYVLHEALSLTKSQFGYIYLYDEEKEELSLNSWTKGVMEECSVAQKHTIYQLENTGIWGEVVRQRKAICVNDFQKPNPLKKGYPKGHVELTTYLSVPVIIDKKIVAVVGLANNPIGYDENDIYEMTLLMMGTWNAVERREAQEKLSLERNKYLQTLISIGDGVMVVDKEDKIEMLNTVAENITGWSFNEAFGKHYKEVFIISHEEEGQKIKDPIQEVWETDKIQEMGNNAMLISKDGKKYYLEDSAAPIKNEAGETVGAVLVFRDVSDKKEQRKKIEYLSFHDSLTGLYNRRFFEEEMKRLDAKRNLPISIIIGDVNGLKLTNDIYGHVFGDMLLQKVAQVLQSICRADDIIARWGGDEFVLLLPKTNSEEAEKIIARIKDTFANEQVNAIKGSISMGSGTKESDFESILDVLNKAEEKMYLAKTLERQSIKGSAIKSIVQTLHENSPREKEHAERVSELCEKMGKELKLPRVEIRKLKEAGYLHDIGKIVLEEKILKQSASLSSIESNELKKHPVVGFRILNSFDNTVDLAESVLAHHEHWDGSGYPKGLMGEEIPLLARVIAVVQSYDRFIYETDPHNPIDARQATAFIRKNAGSKFDPQIAEIFAAMIEKEIK